MKRRQRPRTRFRNLPVGCSIDFRCYHGVSGRCTPESGSDAGSAHCSMAFMNNRLTIDKAGRVVIPKPLREQLHLEPGDALEMEAAGEQITLRPVRGNAPLKKEHGVWVFHIGQSLPASSTDELLQQIREERDTSNLGKSE
jgi:AbrB family looped-hinge helix DNA binding protein